MSAGIHEEASELAPPSSGAPSLSVKGCWAPPSLGPALMIACHAPSPNNVSDPEGGGDSAGGTPSHGPLQGHCWLLGKLSASSGTVGGPPISCCIPQITLPTRSFKQVNLKGYSKLYICEWCKKQTSNRDSMVSHCPQEHLGIHLGLCTMQDELFRSLEVLSP